MESEHQVQSQSERIMAAVQAATTAFVEVLFVLLPAERQHLKASFIVALGNLFTEVISGSTVMASGVVVALDQRIDGHGTRIAALERQAGADGK